METELEMELKLKLTHKKGLSLIELLVGMSISLIVAGVISAVFIDSWRAQIAQETYAALQQGSRASVDEISASIKVASAVAVTVSSGGDTYNSDASLLVLQTPAIDESGNILNDIDYLIFRRNPSDSTLLERIIIADDTSSRASLPSPFNLNNFTGNLVFSYFNAAGTTINPNTGDLTTSTSVGVLVDSQKVANGRTISRQIDNRVYLRNN